MNRRPETRYAWNGDVALAYQVFGEGPVDLVYMQGWASHVELNWESPALSRFLHGLGRHARVIHTDRRGWGCSDRFSPGDVEPLETQVDDLVAVMDAAGSRRAVIIGSWDTTLSAMLFAASNPDRCAGLVLLDPYVTYVATDETPWMYSEAGWEQALAGVRVDWGTEAWAVDLVTLADPWELGWFLPWMRSSIAPGAVVAETRTFYRIDVRDILPSIRVPTLVAGTPLAEQFRENARFIAGRIPGARLVEEPSQQGDAWFHWYQRGPRLLEAIGRLVAGIRDERATLDRVLATVLFTDIVGSTGKAADLGDARWSRLVAQHDARARAEVERFRGTWIRGTGDGLLATFDGPARGVRCAQALVESMRALGLEIRAGLHTGEIELAGADLAGLGVHIGARIGALAGPGEVLVSSTVKDLTIGAGLAFEDGGEHELRGVPGRWRVYRAVGQG
jgi:class 3 adenylate cyclase/pimeloyl-ACP methyl ester carboxylesterase